jgi:hypothetical protein
MTIYTNEIWEKQEDGTMKLIESIVTEVFEPTPEEIIAEKQAELLRVYAELEALKLK